MPMVWLSKEACSTLWALLQNYEDRGGCCFNPDYADCQDDCLQCRKRKELQTAKANLQKGRQ